MTERVWREQEWRTFVFVLHTYDSPAHLLGDPARLPSLLFESVLGPLGAVPGVRMELDGLIVGGRPTVRKLTGAVVARLEASEAPEEIGSMLFNVEVAGEPPQPGLAVWLMLEQSSPAFARSVWVQSQDGLTTRLESRDAWQARLVDLMKTIAVRSHAVTGAIGRNAEILLSPSNVGEHPVEATCAEYVRGHHWGLVLGPRQIDALGGVARVVAEAPFAVAESFGTPEHPLVYLQATETAEDEWTPSDEIARFLLPVTHPDAGGTRIVPPPVIEEPQPGKGHEESDAPRPRFVATHKWEADDEHGEVLGPLILKDNQTGTITLESDDWITRSEAIRLADENGWSLGFDG